ncbi:MAG: hypothetical protein K2Q32_08400, partial [Alphaproteobacteria bacterium]|nr:hypothetical protein [Alphaproteobacteria bacterium]
FPGDRSVDGLVRWQSSSAPALTILMYGSNDALNHGNSATGTVNVKTFSDVLGLLIKRRQQQGAKILVLSPPPIGGPKSEKDIEPYRMAAKKVAGHLHVMFMDTSILTKQSNNIWLTDKVHLTSAANQFLAHEIAKLIACHE